MDELLVIWLHRLISSVSLIACLIVLFYMNRIRNRTFGCVSKSFAFISLGVFFVTLRILSLNLNYFGIFEINQVWGLINDLLTFFSMLFSAVGAFGFSAVGAFGFSRVISFMPRSILEKINENC